MTPRSKAKLAPDSSTRFSLQLRLVVGKTRAIGPGKADLLERIANTGSITDAAREMRMSYRRAWGLIREMNQCFRTPLVETQVGGATGGNTCLTPLGKRILADYRAAESAALKAATPKINSLRRNLRS